MRHSIFTAIRVWHTVDPNNASFFAFPIPSMANSEVRCRVSAVFTGDAAFPHRISAWPFLLSARCRNPDDVPKTVWRPGGRNAFTLDVPKRTHSRLHNFIADSRYENVLDCYRGPKAVAVAMLDSYVCRGWLHNGTWTFTIKHATIIKSMGGKNITETSQTRRRSGSICSHSTLSSRLKLYHALSLHIDVYPTRPQLRKWPLTLEKNLNRDRKLFREERHDHYYLYQSIKINHGKSAPLRRIITPFWGNKFNVVSQQLR